MSTGPGLQRRLGTRDAVLVGLGAMLGTGVFVVPAPAAARAGGALLPALALAALVALLNALTVTRLAAATPESGGIYAYARSRLGPTWAFAAGIAFCAGKTASCAAAALAVGAYLLPEAPRLAAVVAVLVVTALDLRGVERTARATLVLVTVVLLVLAAVVVGALPGAELARLGEGWRPGGILPAAGLFFFAFAGYARITVLGAEVRDPARTIPRAVVIALAVALVVYAAVSAAVLAALGPEVLARSDAPLAAAAPDGLAPVVRVAGALAALGALLSLVAGIGRTAQAMAQRRDAPSRLAGLSERGVPRNAELVVAAVVVVAVLTGGLTGAVALSAFSVLLYYAIGHLCVLRAGGGSRAVAAAGLTGCLTLALTVPLPSVLLGAALLAAAVAARVLVRLRVSARSVGPGARRDPRRRRPGPRAPR